MKISVTPKAPETALPLPALMEYNDGSIVIWFTEPNKGIIIKDTSTPRRVGKIEGGWYPYTDREKWHPFTGSITIES